MPSRSPRSLSAVGRGLVVVLAVLVLVVAVWWVVAGRRSGPERGADSDRVTPLVAQRPPGDRAGTPQARQAGPPADALAAGTGRPVPAGPSLEAAPRGASPAAWQVEETIRRIFAAFNAQDLEGFLAGWTPRGFQQAFEFPIAAAGRLESDLFTESGPYTIDGFASTEAGPQRATTQVDITNGQRKERHRMTLARHEGPWAWKIDRDEKLPVTLPRNIPTVDVNITARSLAVSSAEVVAQNVAFRVANADDHPHELVVMRRVVASGAHESLGHVGPLRPSEHATLLLTDLTPGPYVLVCNMLDSDGVPYSSKGLRAELTIR